MFCFPSGAVHKRRPPITHSYIQKQVFTAQGEPDSYHIFVLNRAPPLSYLYGICVQTVIPFIAPGAGSLPNGQAVQLVSTSYCILSSYPCFAVHLKILHALLNQHRCSLLNRIHSLEDGWLDSDPMLFLDAEARRAPSRIEQSRTSLQSLLKTTPGDTIASGGSQRL